MASSGGSPGPLAKSEDQGSTHNNKRARTEEAAATGLVGWINANTASPEEKRQGKAAAAAAAAATVGEGPSSAPSPHPAVPTVRTPPLPARYPPLAMPAPRKACLKPVVRKAPWELRIAKLSEKDPRRDLPTVMGPPDILTARDVITPRDKAVGLDVARSIVTVIYHCIDDVDTMRPHHFSGFVVGWNQTRKCARILTSYETISPSEPKPKLQVRLPNKSVLEGKLLFFDRHYEVALLEISSRSDLPLQLPSFGSNPNYGQEVFVLGRDHESYLMARHGRIEWLDETDYLGRHCHMFLSCEASWCGHGGPVIDPDGNVIGMAFQKFTSNRLNRMLTISTILTCMEMWMKFSCIAHPVHGLHLRTVKLLPVSLLERLSLDHNINSGYIVDEVSVGSTSQMLGIRCGEVIISFDGLHDYTLPQLEDFFLSVGGRFLERSVDSSFMVDVKLEVYDPLGQRGRTVTLPVRFSVASEIVEGEIEDKEEED